MQPFFDNLNPWVFTHFSSSPFPLLMAFSNVIPKLFLLILLCSISIPRGLALALSPSSSTTKSSSLHSSKTTLCKSTPYPDQCFNSLKLSLSLNIGPDLITHLLQSLRTAISEAEKLSGMMRSGGNLNIVEKLRGTMLDCQQLQQITVSCLQRSASLIQSADHSQKIEDARAYLSAALTNKNTCLEGLESASGPFKPILTNLLVDAYKYVSNSLSLLPRSGVHPKGLHNRRLMNAKFPTWMSKKDRRILQSDDEYDPSQVLTVAADGTGNFTTITDAVNFAPNSSNDRIIIYITQGVYEENVEIPSNKPNIVFLGDGHDLTIITGKRSVGDGWTTFRSATLAVSGDGFLARDITIMNTAGPEKHQAVALRLNADLTALYRCSINGYQDSLYVHSFRQFYRECNISGTIDYIFGNAAVVFQACNIISIMPMPNQFTVITAQSRDTPDEVTGISIQNCSVIASDELNANRAKVKSYLGRPWRVYSRSVYIGSYIDEFIEPMGWTKWNGDEGLETLYYGEYGNYGPGSGTDNRVSWGGYHKMDYYDAYNFTVSEFITGDEWLDSTSFPYDQGI